MDQKAQTKLLLERYNEEGITVEEKREIEGEIISININLIRKTTLSFVRKSRSAEFDDCFQEASLGMINAIQNYKFEKDVEFSTFAVACMGNKIRQSLERENRSTYIKHEIRNLADKKGRLPTVEEICDHQKISEDEFYNYAYGPVHLEDKIKYNEDEAELADFMPSPINVEKAGINNAILDDIEREIAKMPLFMRYIVKRVFYDQEKKKVVAEELGMKRQMLSNYIFFAQVMLKWGVLGKDILGTNMDPKEETILSEYHQRILHAKPFPPEKIEMMNKYFEETEPKTYFGEKKLNK